MAGSAPISLPSAETLRKLLRYDPETGLLFWRSRGNYAWDRRFSGKRAFTSQNNSGYFVGGINRKSYVLHRVAWKIVHGEDPERIDHVNGDKADNRLCNLRSVTHQENQKNTPRPKHNKSGVVGVCLDKRSDKWFAQIQVNGKCVNLGLYDDFSSAVQARKTAEIKFGFHENHGREAA